MTDGSPQTETPLIAVAGASCVDMTLRQPPLDWIGRPGQDRYRPETVLNLKQPPELGIGGNGAAAAYVLGMLGLRVALNGPTGEDAAGQLIRGWLADANVELVAQPGRSTMFSITPVDARSRRLVCLQYPSPPIDWMASARNDDASWLLLAAHSQVQAGELKQVEDALRHFQSRGGMTALDTGIGWMRTSRADEVTQTWAHVDLLIGTLDELKFWTGRDDPEDVAERARGLGARRVMIKMGADGAAWTDEDGVYAHQPARSVERSDVSIGAGDGFNGALIARLVRGESVESAVNFAQSVAANIVEIGNGVTGWGACRS